MATQEHTSISNSKQSEAEAYDKLMDCHSADKKFSKDLNILNRVQPLEGCKVLDLGCGTGNYTYMLAERVGPTGSVIGVDPDKERIKIAREKWTRDNLTFIEGDDQTYPEDQYDLIFSHYVLHWIKNKQQTFERAYKNLRLGGQFAFVSVMGISPVGKELAALMDPEGRQEILNDMWHTVPVENYKTFAITAGFTVAMIELDTDVYVARNIEAMFSCWHGVTGGLFDASKVDLIELDRVKQKYAGEKVEHKVPVVRAILTKN